jgi:putative ABC transport system permease protein
MVTPDYFKTYGIRLVKGRFLTDADNAGALHVAVVNEELVQHYLPGQDPIGQVLMVDQIVPGVQKIGDSQPWQIVGVFHNVRGGYFRRQREEIVVPFSQSPWVYVDVGVRTAGDPAAMTKTITAAVHAVDPTLALSRVQTLDQIRDDDLSGDRFNLVLYVIFAAIALLLAAVGIYGVMAFAVGQRTHEIGVRMALGANRSHIVRMVLRDAAILLAIGLAAGMAMTIAAGNAAASMLFGLKPRDPMTLVIAIAGIVVVGLAASVVPAQRAANIHPVAALREE